MCVYIMCVYISICIYVYHMGVYLQGVLSAIPLIFILPSACFLKLSPGRWFHSEKLLPSLLLLAGGVLVLSGLVLSGLFPHSCTHGDEPSYCNASRTAPPG